MSLFGPILARIGTAFRALWRALSRRRGPTPGAIAATTTKGILEGDQAPIVDAEFVEIQPGRAGDAPPTAAAADERAPGARTELLAEESHAREREAREAEERARQEAAQREAREAEERARQEAAQSEAREAEERARQEAAQSEAREAEERARQEAAQREAREAEERARQEAAQREAREAEERARQEAAQREAREAEERARQEAAQREAREAEERARQEARALERQRDEEEKERKRRDKEAAKQRAEQQRLAAEAAHAAARRHVEEQIREHARARLEAELEARRRDLDEAIRRRAALVIPSDYVPSAESEHEMYQISVTEFAGPLDLLLFLIRRHEIDIFDIPIAFICARYLEYVQIMQELNIDVAAEFMHMAAELMHIKSKMLLPKPAEVEEDEEDVDPRAELVHRLLEYQKYKDAAMTFAATGWLDRDTFEREPERIDLGRHDAPLREVGVFALIEAFDAVLKRQQPELRHQVLLDEVSVAERIRRFAGVLVGRQTVRFEELLGELVGRLDIIVSFLALLEMTKFQLLRIHQSEEGQLYVSPRYDSIEEAMQHIEDRLVSDEAQYAG